MIVCDDIAAQIALFLDGELEDQERREFGQHVKSCRLCHERVAHETAFLKAINDARPLSAASVALRLRVETVLQSAPLPVKAPSF